MTLQDDIFGSQYLQTELPVYENLHVCHEHDNGFIITHCDRFTGYKNVTFIDSNHSIPVYKRLIG